MRRRAFRIAALVSLVAFGLLLFRSYLLVNYFGEYEPKFGKGMSLALAALGDAIVAAVVLGLAFLATLAAIWSRALSVLGAALVLLACAATLLSPGWKRASARRAVRYVYWRNFHAGRPLPAIHALEQPRLETLLHGITGLARDPWGRPYHYELLPDTAADHPHRKNWDIQWAFWSTGPNGLDDGDTKRDDIDVTNSGL
jgi:fatty acid desaturase